MESKPIILVPATKSYVWGGTKLKNDWGKQSDEESIAETWELSCHPDGMSIDKESGKTLSEILRENPNFIGNKANSAKDFPILIKLIDAKTNLSIQVHPDDDYARIHEGQFGKTEMWYILEADNGAGVYCGFKQKTDKNEIRQRLNDGTITDILNFIPLKKGDFLYIPSGTVHAICAGLTVCEVQENSSVTYRLYDYGRTDKNGNPRELHIEKSLDVIDSQSECAYNTTIKNLRAGVRELIKCDYFTTLEITGSVYNGTIDADSFKAVSSFCDCVIECGGCEYNVLKGETVFLPANLGEFTVKSNNLWILITNL